MPIAVAEGPVITADRAGGCRTIEGQTEGSHTLLPGCGNNRRQWSRRNSACAKNRDDSGIAAFVCTIVGRQGEVIGGVVCQTAESERCYFPYVK